MAFQGVLLRILSQEKFVKNSGYSGHPKTGVLNSRSKWKLGVAGSGTRGPS